MSLNGAIDDHATGTYTVTRTAKGPLVQGRPTDGAVTTYQLVASVQPFDGSLKDLEEGQVVENAKSIFAYPVDPAIEPHSRAAGIEPDVIDIDGDDYRIEKCLKWDHWGERHFVITAYKLTAV